MITLIKVNHPSPHPPATESKLNIVDLHATGPGNVWLRNKVQNCIFSANNETQKQTAVGNVIYDKMISVGESHFTGANYLAGDTQWGNLSSSAVIPASLYSVETPSFFGSSAYPPFGGIFFPLFYHQFDIQR